MINVSYNYNNMAQLDERYLKILDDLLDKSGGKEYCLKQILTESDYKRFAEEYKKEHKKDIFDRIQEKFYKTESGTRFDENNFANLEISQSQWNRYIMKFYFYDNVNHRIFEYYVKTDQIENVPLFQDERDVFSGSFFSKLKNGNTLWDKFSRDMEEIRIKKEVEKMTSQNLVFREKLKRLKFLEEDAFSELKSIKLTEQHPDKHQRYVYDNHFYYYVEELDGYVTFQEGEDLLLNSAFLTVFNEKVVRKLAVEQKPNVPSQDDSCPNVQKVYSCQ